MAKMDIKEFELPETLFACDIEGRVFQAIALQCLAKADGVALAEGNLLDTLLGRDPAEHLKGIHVERDAKGHSVSIQVEVNIAYGVNIPQKAEELQNLIVQEVSRLTGLRVAAVHVIFKGLIPSKPNE